MSYILGFFAADGNMIKTRRETHYISLEICDKEIIEKYKLLVKAEHKIGQRKSKEDGTIRYRLQIGSEEIYHDLEKLGFRDNKTFNMCLPNIPPEYLSDFVRGYFDGDGNVWVGIRHKKRKNGIPTIQTVFTSCSENFLFNLYDRLKDVGIFKGTVRKGKGNYFRLVYSIHSSLKLYHFMYNHEATSQKPLFLKRKKDIFEKYVRMRL